MHQMKLRLCGCIGCVLTTVVFWSVVMLIDVRFPAAADGEELQGPYEPTRYGLALKGWKNYDAHEDILAVELAGVVQFDYDRIWRHKAPDGLRFKIEGGLGLLDASACRLVASAGIMAQQYVSLPFSSAIRPYVEAGIGLIYTDYQREGQGLRINFNPQAGIGFEIPNTSRAPFFLNIRLHHISNGGLDKDNTGINSVVIGIGWYLWQ